MNNRFHQYETFHKITLVICKIAKPDHLGAKEDQSLISGVILRSTRYQEKDKKKDP